MEQPKPSNKRSNEALVPPLTLRQRLWVLPFVARLPLAIAIGVFHENKGRSWSHAANIAATRCLLNHKWEIHILRSFVGVTTSIVYQNWARQDKQEVLTDFLAEAAKLHWIGPRRDAPQDRVFLYFHGGGFSCYARPDYCKFLRALQKDLSTSFGDIGIAMLEYSLTPDSPFPTQLRQANAALSHLLNKGISPANIVIGGDSAGGSLVLQLASHILHPLSSIPPPPVLTQPLGGAMLISPWCSYNVDAPSYTQNNGKDLIPVHSYAFFSRIARAALTPELQYHCEPLSAPAEWWKGLDGVYARVLVTAGEYECPFDQIIETSTVISRYVKDTVMVVDPGEVHTEMIVRFATGEGGFGKGYDAMVGLLSRSLQNGSKNGG